MKKLLREFVRQTLVESRFKQMSKFKDLKNHLASGDWMNVDAGGDYDEEFYSLGSEAQQELIVSLNDYFDDKFGIGEITVTVKVDEMLTLISEGADKVLKAATYYFDGLHNIELVLAQLEDGQTLSELGNVSQKIYEVVTHELLHMQQFLKFSKGEPTEQKFNQFMSSYKEAGGPKGMAGDYFFFDQADGASELETFSFQIANELIDAVGKDQAIFELQKNAPDYEFIRNNSSSFRAIESQNPDVASRKEMRDMIKRAKQYAKRM